MFLILKFFLTIMLFFFLVTFIGGLSLFLRIKQHLQNPFLRPDVSQPPPPAGKGDIIEGEFTVLDEKNK